MNVVNTFVDDKNVFLREQGSKMYSVLSYYCAKIISDVPMQIISPTLFCLIVYWIIGFDSSVDKFLNFVVILILTANIGSSFGLLLAVMTKSSQVGVTLTPMVIIPFMVFSGFFINSDSTPVYFAWIEYISFIKYAFESVVLNEFSDLTFVCKESELVGGICPITGGQQVLDSLSFDGSILINIIILLSIYAVIRILGYFFLLRLAKSNKVAA